MNNPVKKKESFVFFLIKWIFITCLAVAFLPLTIGLFLGWLVFKKINNKIIKIGLLVIIATLTIAISNIWAKSIQSQPTPTNKIATPNPILESTKDEVSKTPNPNIVKVTKIIDGDTIETEGGQRVRYIGIDTPEKDSCYFNEAKNKNKELIEGKNVRLEKDISETDRYGRLLRYVYLDDIFINKVLVEKGYAQVYTYPPDVKFNNEFTNAQKNAREAGVGLWSECKNTKQLNINPNNFSTTTTANPQNTNSSCIYSCSGPDRDCSDFKTHNDAQTFFNCCGFSKTFDPMKLDKSSGEGNGIACEALP